METSPSLGWRSSIEAWFDVPLARVRLGYAAWLFGIFCYFLPPATWSPVSRFNVTRSVVEAGQLNIDRYADSTGDRARVGDHWYSDKAPLLALLAVPVYQVHHWSDRARGKAPAYEATGTDTRPAARIKVNRSFQRALYVCSISTAAIAGVALGLLLFELLLRRMEPTAALAGSGLVVLSLPTLPYATSFYGHVAAAALLTAAFVLLDQAREHRAERLPQLGRSAAAGACLAASVGCEYLAAVPALAFIAHAAFRFPPKQWPTLFGGMALGAAGPALVIGAYHWACFGAPWRTGYSYIVNPTFAAGHARGLLGVQLPRAEALWGLLFGRMRGLFYVAPVALPLAVGLIARARTKDATALGASLALLALLLVNSSYYMWWGGAAAGPRHLVPVLGLLALGFPWVWQRRWLRRATIALGAISAFNMLAVCAVGLEAPERGDLLLDFVYPRLFGGRIAMLSGASNLGIELGLMRAASVVPLLAWLIFGGHILARQIGEATSPRSSVHA